MLDPCLFSFYHNVLKRCLSQGSQELCAEVLNNEICTRLIHYQTKKI